MRKASAQKVFTEWAVARSFKVRCESQYGNDGRKYYLVRRWDLNSGWQHMYAGSGDTPVQAWRNACDKRGLDYYGKKP